MAWIGLAVAASTLVGLGEREVHAYLDTCSTFSAITERFAELAADADAKSKSEGRIERIICSTSECVEPIVVAGLAGRCEVRRTCDLRVCFGMGIRRAMYILKGCYVLPDGSLPVDGIVVGNGDLTATGHRH